MPELAPPVVLPVVLPEALEPLLTPPHCLTQLSRSMPDRPMHWLGRFALPAALVSELVLAPPAVLPPVLEPVLPLTLEPLLVPAPVLPPALPGVALVGGAPALLPAEPAALPPVCAHDTLATPTSAAATAAVIVLTITVESPWSVEENCTPRRAKKVPSRL